MRTLTTTAAIFTVSLALVSAGRAQAPQSFRAISPIFGQLVSFAMPSNFVAVFETPRAATTSAKPCRRARRRNAGRR